MWYLVPFYSFNCLMQIELNFSFLFNNPVHQLNMTLTKSSLKDSHHGRSVVMALDHDGSVAWCIFTCCYQFIIHSLTFSRIGFQYLWGQLTYWVYVCMKWPWSHHLQPLQKQRENFTSNFPAFVCILNIVQGTPEQQCNRGGYTWQWVIVLANKIVTFPLFLLARDQVIQFKW